SFITKPLSRALNHNDSLRERLFMGPDPRLDLFHQRLLSLCDNQADPGAFDRAITRLLPLPMGWVPVVPGRRFGRTNFSRWFLTARLMLCAELENEGGGVIAAPVGQRGGDDPAAARVQADVQRPPGAPPFGAALLNQPFGRPTQLAQPETQTEVGRCLRQRSHPSNSPA
ncbi:hypothetical protein, partial [Azospirillum sp. TSH58]|uniref:hypothetical protein n=1 Tax=Azospirillum sp. TSH58 TaxID=664962 RepID=UPI001B3BAE23